MKQSIFVIIIFLGLNMNLKAQNSSTSFVQRHTSAAQELGNQYGIPVSIILGVAMHESANGQSRNAKELNNFFGVKGANNLTTRKSAYKQFQDAAHSFQSFCEMLKRKGFYEKLKGNMNPMNWLKAMETANYAQAPEWKGKIMATIQKEKLTAYDKKQL